MPSQCHFPGTNGPRGALPQFQNGFKDPRGISSAYVQVPNTYKFQITDDSVRRGLIVGNSIEQTILIEDLQEATDVMEQRRQGDHIGMCFSINKQSPDWGHKVGGAYVTFYSFLD